MKHLNQDNQQQGQAMNTLVIDDEPRYREHIEHFLQRKGFRTHVVANPNEARKRLAVGDIDLLIADIRLADQVDGLDLAQWAREKDANLAVIVITGYSSPEYQRRSHALGAFAYLEKPFELTELGLHVQRVLDQRELLREVSRLEQELAAARSELDHQPVWSGIPLACVAEDDGQLLVATGEGRRAIETVSAPELERPLRAVDQDLLQRVRRAVDGDAPAGWVTLFRRDGVLSEYRTMVRRMTFNQRAALMLLMLDAAEVEGGIADGMWSNVLLRASQVQGLSLD